MLFGIESSYMSPEPLRLGNRLRCGCLGAQGLGDTDRLLANDGSLDLKAWPETETFQSEDISVESD